MSSPRYAFITFRAQPNEQKLTDYFLQLIFPKIRDSVDSYCLAQEDYGTPSHHCHIIFSHNYKDNQKFEQQLLLFKKAKEFYESTKTLNTKIVYTGKTRFVGSSSGGTSYGLDSKWDISQTSEKDYKYYLGYLHKNPDTVHSIKGFTQQQVIESVKYYSCSEGIKLLDPSKNIWRILNTRNAHSYITDFCEKNKIIINDDLDERLLKKQLASKGISVVELSNNKYEHIIQDLIEYNKGIPLCSTIENMKNEIQLLKEMYHNLENELDELDPKVDPFGHPWSRNTFNL